MNNSITRREVAKQFIIVIELLLEWIDQIENSIIMYTTLMNPIFLSILAGLGGMFGWEISDFFAGLFS